jgi:DNA-binding PadR family transcriptional regulator
MAQKATVRTPVALAVLNLLGESELHPYEMRRRMAERGLDRLVKVRGGILYHTVQRLDEAGLVEPTETSREGRYPERTVYRLTEHGAEELRDWMSELLATPPPEYPLFPAALAFLPSLPLEVVLDKLNHRTVHLEARIAAEEAGVRAASAFLNRIHVVEDEYIVAVLRTELAFVRQLVQELRDGTIPWRFGPLDPGAGGGGGMG